MSLLMGTAGNESSAPLSFRSVGRVVYGIGAQKAGTTWLYEQLRAHPDVHMGDVKEVHYWDTIYFPHLPYYKPTAEKEFERLSRMPFLLRSLRYGLTGQARKLLQAERYRQALSGGEHSGRAYQAFLMEGWQGEPVVGDISPGYAMLEPQGFAAMNAAAPDARFLFIMRDPISRLWSAMRHNRSRGFINGDKNADLGEAFTRALEAPDKGPMMMTDYATTIRNLEAAVPPERIGYFFFETLFSQESVDRISEFLGIGWMQADAGQVVNPGSDPGLHPSPELTRLAFTKLSGVYSFVYEKFGSRVPPDWLK